MMEAQPDKEAGYRRCWLSPTLAKRALRKFSSSNHRSISWRASPIRSDAIATRDAKSIDHRCDQRERYRFAGPIQRRVARPDAKGQQILVETPKTPHHLSLIVTVASASTRSAPLARCRAS